MPGDVEPDTVLMALIADAQYLIAADRYEEITGDSTLAAIMRIEGLEWELIAGKPAFKMIATQGDHEKLVWWDLQCGQWDFDWVTFTAFPDEQPKPRNEGPIHQLMQKLGMTEEQCDCFYRLYCDAVERECSL
jgi:hypothetical protein